MSHKCDAPSSILILRLGAIGDVVHGLPLLNRLRRGFPSAKLAWLVGPKAAPILENHPALDQLIVAEKRRPLELLAATKRIRREKFDVAIDLQGLTISGLLTGLTGARVRLGWDVPRVRE